MRAKMNHKSHTQKYTGRGVMVWDEASWLSCRGMGQTWSKRNLELDPPTEPSKTGDSPECWDDRLTVAMVLLWAPVRRSTSSMKMKEGT